MKPPRNVCGCGLPVAEHDKPTRAAMRAYARSTAELWTERRWEAVTAFRDAMPRRQAYHLDEAYDAGSHAHLYAVPTTEGVVTLIRSNDEGRSTVEIRQDRADGTVSAVDRWNGRTCDVQACPYPKTSPAAAIRRWTADFESHGYVKVYDWSSR